MAEDKEKGKKSTEEKAEEMNRRQQEIVDFLNRLDDFDKKSRETDIMVK